MGRLRPHSELVTGFRGELSFGILPGEDKSQKAVIFNDGDGEGAKETKERSENGKGE